MSQVQMASTFSSAEQARPLPEIVSHVDTKKRVTIFSPALEKLNIILALVITFGSLLSLLILTPAMNAPFYGLTMTFLIQIVLLNVTHNAFSFMLPLVSPEVRLWWKESRHFGLTTTTATLLVFLAGFIFIFCTEVAARHLGMRREGYLAYLIVFNFFSRRHGLGQAFGLSRLYDQRLRERFGPPDEKTLKLRNWQRYLFHCLLFLTLPQLLIPDMVLNEKWAIAILNPLSIVSIIMAGTITILAYKETHGNLSNKYLFLLRLAPLCFTSYTNPWPFYAVLAIHALESAIVTISMSRASYKIEKNLKWAVTPYRRYWGWALGALAFVIICAQFRDFMFGDIYLGFFPDQATLVSILVATSVAMGGAHFFLDEMMFKMRKSEVRKHIAPLLAQEEAS